MNTETLNALKIVRDAKTNVLAKLTANDVSKSDKQFLGNLLLVLEDEEDALINLTLQDMVNKINASNEALQRLITQMQHASDNISSLSNTIKKVSHILSAFTEITSKAISVGLLG